MSMKVLFVVYDNGSYDHVFPMGFGAIGAILNPLVENFNFKNPSAMVPQLVAAYELLKQSKKGHWRSIKLKELEHLILASSGIFLEAVSTTESINPGGNFTLKLEAVNRSTNNVILSGVTTSSGKVNMTEMLGILRTFNLFLLACNFELLATFLR